MSTKRWRSTGGLNYTRNKRMRMFDAEWENELRKDNARPSTSAQIPSADAPIPAAEALPESVSQEAQEDEESIPVGNEDSDDGADSSSNDDLFSDFSEDSECSADSLDGRNVQFRDKLRRWALSCNLTHFAVGSLLTLLKEETSFKLPKDPRTLLKTPKATSNVIENIGGGEFWYNGVANCLTSYFTNIKPKASTFWLDFAMDGLPIHKSGPTQLWPILMRVTDVPQAPVFVVALFCGKTKPASAEDYLRQLVTELNQLQSTCIVLSGIQVKIRVRAIIADTPARAFIKGVISHNGYDSCLKCTEHSVYDEVTHRMYFSGVDAPKRIAKEFKEGKYKRHCKNTTPLTALDFFDIIDDVPTTDRLHLIDLGVMRYLMRSWKKGTFGQLYKWNLEDIEYISSVMDKVKLPSEVPRKLRSIHYLKFWKGAEFKNFLHYPSIVALKDTLPEAAYEHFKLFFCAITIFSSPAHEQHYELAHEMLLKFVRDYATLYGECFISSNVHNLKHVYDDVCSFGSFDEYSTYVYESALQVIKHLIRTGNNIMPQVINRIKEIARMLNEHLATVAQDSQQYPAIVNKGSGMNVHIRKNFTLKKGQRDQWFMLNNDIIMKFSNATLSDSKVTVEGQYFLKQRSYFMKPCNSALLHIYATKLNDLSTYTHMVSVDEIKCKLVTINIDEESMLVIPLLHTLEN